MTPATFLAFALAALDPAPTVLALDPLQGTWHGENGTALVIDADAIDVIGSDGFDSFTGRLKVTPRARHFAIVATGERPTECRYRLDGERSTLEVAGKEIEYRRKTALYAPIGPW